MTGSGATNNGVYDLAFKQAICYESYETTDMLIAACR